MTKSPPDTDEPAEEIVKDTWTRWLERLRQFGEAIEFSELDFLEGRIRHLEAQVAELRAQAAKP